MASVYINLLLSCLVLVLHPPPTACSEWVVTPIQGPSGGTVDSITLSAELLWSLIGPDIYNCHLPTTCFSTLNDWSPVNGRLDQIDAGYDQVWGANHIHLVYKRNILEGTTLESQWIRVIPSGRSEECTTAFDASEVSVSNDGTYVWVLSTLNEVFKCTKCGCGSSSNVNWISVDNKTRPVHIEVGDEEVWGVNATNHILKRPVNGSGEWRSVPGEMRYISASGYRYVWGIAPNDSLYNCEMPCDNGEWQYIGEDYKQIEASFRHIVGLTNDNVFVVFSEDTNTSGKNINEPNIPSCICIQYYYYPIRILVLFHIRS